ncbi:hypothetical protein LCGC14_1725730 [marine sediment metagenome]|uniref:Uncharacterized protein n=1 Tax=marine sediment metagenome TaxID=412755 RepID=A0A0F9HYY3_9ZZZZ
MRVIRHIKSSFGKDDPPDNPEAKLAALSDEQLMECRQEKSEELSRRSQHLPFLTFGDHCQAQTLGLELGYIEDELDRRTRT